jgi:hypothetical protein
MTRVLATGADERYGYHLLNLLGSVKTNADVFDEIVAFDLGLSPHQRELLESVEGVAVQTVPAFVPHWSQGFTWKPWAWIHVRGDEVVWLDAGTTVLRPVDELLAHIDDHGYFVVSQGHPVADIVPSDYYELYEFPRELGNRTCVAGGIVGFARGSHFYERVIVPTYEDCLAGRSLGFSASEVDRTKLPLERTDSPIVRDCKHFRWDQTLLNIHLYLEFPNPVIADLDQFAGWRSSSDHPQQVIWGHRRGGDLAYLARVPYKDRSLQRRAWSVRYRLRWWRRRNQRFFSPSAYLWKVRKLRGDLRGRARRGAQR